jgi:hypothetical protein
MYESNTLCTVLVETSLAAGQLSKTRIYIKMPAICRVRNRIWFSPDREVCIAASALEPPVRARHRGGANKYNPNTAVAAVLSGTDRDVTVFLWQPRPPFSLARLTLTWGFTFPAAQT